jgi:hypothetical protein
MKSILAALMAAFLLIGCDKSNPIDSPSSANAAQSLAMFSELSMANTANATLATDISTMSDDGALCAHDSIRNARMLDSLKAYLSLTDIQFSSLNEYGITLFTSLGEIRSKVVAGAITRDSARTLVKAARDQFVASVISMLTPEQATLFETWLTLYWDKTPHRGGPGRRGDDGGPGGLNDSLRHAQMLDSLKAYLSLTDVQFASLKEYGTVLMTTLGEIKTKVNAHAISPDSARTLGKAARDQFIASVKSILTTDQVGLLEKWLTIYGEKPPHRGGPHGGPGGRRP